MRDKICQHAALWLQRHQQQRPLACYSRILHNTFAIKHSSLTGGIVGRGNIRPFEIQRNAFTGGTDNVFIGKSHCFAEEATLFYADVGHTSCRRVKYDVYQYTVLAIGTEYLAYKMKLLHFSDCC